MVTKRTSQQFIIKKMLCFVLSICMLLGLSFNISYAAEATTVSVMVSNVGAKPGDTVQVPISTSDIGVIAGYQFSIKYDPAQVTAVDVFDGNTIPVKNLSTANTGEIKFAFASGTALDKSGNLFTINFRVSSTAVAGNAKITLEKELFNDINGMNLVVNKTYGQITITNTSSSNTSTSGTNTGIQTGTITGGNTGTNTGTTTGENTGTNTGDTTGTNTGTGSNTTGTDSSNVVQNVADQNTKLNELINNPDQTNAVTDNQKTQAAQTILNDVANTITEVKDNAAAVVVVNSVSDTLKATKSILDNLKDEKEKVKIVDSINDIVKNSQHAIEKLEDAKASVQLTKELIGSAVDIISNSDKGSAAIKELKKSLVDVTQKVVEKASTVTLEEKLITVKDNAITAQIDEDAVKKQIQAAKEAMTQVKEELSKVVTAAEAKSINTTLTINIPKSDNVDKVTADIPADIVKTVKDDGLDGIKVKMNNVGFTVTPETFAKAKEGEKISLEAEVVGNVTAPNPQSAQRINALPVMEFSARVGDTQVKKFEKPMQVAFDVSEIDLKGLTETQLQCLTVYMLNETTGVWQPVGGKFDPITKTVSVLRSHFSKYTVMQAEKSFSDISNSWAKNEISLMLNKGIINETAKFEPNKNITRAEFAAWIVRLFGFDGKGMSSSFNDVAKNNAYYNEISAAYNEGIINGTSKNAFSPNKNITREEMSTILCRALSKYKGIEVLSNSTAANIAKGIKDSKLISSWAVNSIATVYNNGIINGYKDKTFKAKSNLNKSEAAAIIYRIFNMI